MVVKEIHKLNYLFRICKVFLLVFLSVFTTVLLCLLVISSFGKSLIVSFISGFLSSFLVIVVVFLFDFVPRLKNKVIYGHFSTKARSNRIVKVTSIDFELLKTKFNDSLCELFKKSKVENLDNLVEIRTRFGFFSVGEIIDVEFKNNINGEIVICIKSMSKNKRGILDGGVNVKNTIIISKKIEDIVRDEGGLTVEDFELDE